MTRRLIRADLAAAVGSLHAGGLVAMPTETVYGLAADATDPAAIAKIFAAKGRPEDHPLIVHLADGSDLDEWAPDASTAARTLAATCWPGPLTLIVPRSDLLPAAVAGGRDTVGLRVPAHPMARELIRLAGMPLAAPSANRFGAVSPTTADHVREDLGDAVDVVLDGGPCPVGIESTIVDTTVDPVQILRAGAITAEDVTLVLQTEVESASGPARASGMLASHYAPRCQVRLVDSPDDAFALAAGTPRSRILDLTDDVARYARDLYAELRRADDDAVLTLIAVLPEPAGLGHAVRDRLTKASAPR
jgi:L-threonylcarbamoyladenylate synthase